MSGNQVMSGLTDDAPEGADGWARAMMMDLRGQAEEALAQLKSEKIAPGDAIGHERKIRRITALARAVKAIEALNVLRIRIDKAEAARRLSYGEGGKHGDSPEELADLRSELLRRWDRVRGQIDRCRAAGGDERGPAADHEEPQSGTRTPSDPSEDGLAHLADAGRAGGGQDVRWRVLAA
jgi:hypothetical protein